MALIDEIPHYEYLVTPDQIAPPSDVPAWPTCGGVYVVAAAKLVKIGLARCVCRRLGGLQVGSPVRLSPIGVIPTESLHEARTIERYLHKRFSGLRTRGEWFIETPTLLSYLRPHIHHWPERCDDSRAGKTRASVPVLSETLQHRG